jgi:hypothetical protein
MQPKKVLLKGKIVEVVTIGQLAEMCGRKVITLRKMEERGILPEPVIRGKSMTNKSGDKLPGKRLYSINFAKKIAEILKNVSQGVAITNEQKRQITLAYQEEKKLIE